MALLSVQDLIVRFRTHEGTIHAVNGVTFELDEGETLGIVGESGCGKSVTSLAIMRLLPKPAGRIEGGTVRFDGQDLLAYSESEMRDLRGREVAMIFQDPMTSLNPVLTVEEQMVETIQAHRKISKADARTRAIELLGTVGMPQPETRLKAYPHQFSGGSTSGSDCTGTFSYEFNALIVSGTNPALVLGQQVWAQYWSRDPGFAPPHNSNLTDALTFVIDP